MASIQRRAADLVFEHLREQIVLGERAPGARLDPTEVADELGVSRTPVREAILRLDAEGLVHRLPYRGVVVADLDLDVAEDVAGLRIHLETLAARLAVPRLRAADLAAMRAAHEELGELLAGDCPPARFNELNRAFHSALYQRADSPVLSRTIDGLARQADRFRMHFDPRRGPAHEQHAAILAGCERGDVEAVVDATREHILVGYQLMMPAGRQVRESGVMDAVLGDVEAAAVGPSPATSGNARRRG